MLNWCFYGVLTVQIHIYWTAFPKKSRSVQALVYGVYLLETAQTILLTRDAFQSFVFGFKDPASVNDIQNLWLDIYFFDGLVALLVQFYYANRIRVLLSRFKVIPGIIVLLSITQLACAIGGCIALKNAQFSTVNGNTFTSSTAVILGFLWLGCATIADIIVAVTMVYALSRYDTTFKAS
ncbi:hypothetical protein Moror_2948 [Moniliophthora roreri MCA 2997]|uniref:Uncharacterized protein n=1 Tax=Moniliophthora roreri (strain MCA 2997) TaxID=1381753 RepID=V2XBV3_MONRO|nr:hypothetical protein Moror_2948 [Moniliophthora roreri MCA 2997]